MRNFPQELVDQVIDEVTPNTASIGTCGLVCRRWLPRSRSNLFSRIYLADLATTIAFMDLADASFTPIWSLVRFLDLSLLEGSLQFMKHMARLHNQCHAITALRIHATLWAVNSPFPVQDPAFRLWLQRYIPHFGATCCSLTRFELVLGSDMPLHELVDAIATCGHSRIYEYVARWAMAR
ncbi:hypothetical protein C8J57DRAFT_193770 [Mycena rebaudengoi]|nr:hypothetical protein C8J57DRAFT_193770 [Mycena rebaudengoi]